MIQLQDFRDHRLWRPQALKPANQTILLELLSKRELEEDSDDKEEEVEDDDDEPEADFVEMVKGLVEAEGDDYDPSYNLRMWQLLGLQYEEGGISNKVRSTTCMPIS